MQRLIPYARRRLGMNVRARPDERKQQSSPEVST